MAWCNGCPAAGINDNWMHTDLTHSTASRHAAMIKRAFIRARDPQHVCILKKVFFSLKGDFFFENPNDIFWTHSFLDQNMFPPPKKGSKESVGKKAYMFLESHFLTPFFCLEKQTPEKNDQKKKKKEITRQLKK